MSVKYIKKSEKPFNLIGAALLRMRDETSLLENYPKELLEQEEKEKEDQNLEKT